MESREINRISTIGMTEQEWLAQRKATIGGSEAAAVMGLDPYVSPYTLWQRKKGFVEETQTSLPAEFGKFAEEFVARQFTKQTGKRVKRDNAILYNPAYPFAHANIDRRVIGENAGLECKTTSALNLSKFKNGAYPAKFYVQCVHYMMVCGFERMYLACLIGNSAFEVFVIERNEDEIVALAAEESKFAALLEGNEPPKIFASDAADQDADTLNTLYPECNGERIELFGRDDVFREMEELVERRKEIDKQITSIQNLIKADLGENERGETDYYKCSWSSASKTTYDTKKLFAEHPEIDPGQYAKTSTYRQFRFSTKEVVDNG